MKWVYVYFYITYYPIFQTIIWKMDRWDQTDYSLYHVLCTFIVTRMQTCSFTPTRWVPHKNFDFQNSFLVAPTFCIKWILKVRENSCDKRRFGYGKLFKSASSWLFPRQVDFRQKKKIKVFRKFYSYFSFYAREINFKYYFFLTNWLNFFIEPWKEIENAAKYELILPKPLILTLFWWRL